MKTTAAVLVAPGRPLEMAELEIPTLAPGQVLVEIAYSGACHTQILEVRGHRGDDPWCPHCLGHEAAGTVVERGAGVDKVEVGDDVVLGWIKGRGADVSGTTYGWNGRKVNAGGVTTFSRLAVVSENRLVRLPTGLDPRMATLLGCAAPTGFGSVLNVCAARPGQSLAVFGTGGVGLCAVAAAAAQGCSPVIALDPLGAKLEMARALGATHTFQVGETDVTGILADVVPGGLDFAIEASGRTEVMARALTAVRPRGGTAVVIGNAHSGDTLSLDPGQLNQGKRLLGTWGGDSKPDEDTARFAEILTDARFDFRCLLSEPYPLSAINAALDDLEAGRVGRPLIHMAEV